MGQNLIIALTAKKCGFVSEFKPVPTYAKQYFPGCPYCSTPRQKEETTMKAGNTYAKTIHYGCGTSLELRRVGHQFRGSKFKRVCGPKDDESK